MGNVVNFPTNAVAENVLRGALTTQMEQLDELYDSLDALHHQMHELEKTCNELEYSYDQNLCKYANKVGTENVEVHFMGYTSRHIVSVDADGTNIKLTIDEDMCRED
jgi:uncharacterized protein YbgA (DUF1722 family)|tara:strand:- start:777 stop:1097 length:321 start_codon:yes stop_codon:yes gene_type:complete